MGIGRRDAENESYRQARDQLLDAEKALRDQRETVAALRRELPLNSKIEDYVFQTAHADQSDDGSPRDIRLSGLFEMPDKPLILYHYMYGGAQEIPCPMCTLWMDGFNGIGHHLDQMANIALIAEADIDDFRALGRTRGWSRLRLLSSKGTTFKSDFSFEGEKKEQWPGVSVFVFKDGDVWHTYSASAITGEGEFRGIDLLSPFWNILDLTPEGRGDFMPKMNYGKA